MITLNRRRVMGGKSLPYDAEIEYLESTGTQLMNLGYYPNPLTNLEMIIQFVSIGNEDKGGSNNGIFGTNDTINAAFSANFGGSSGQKNSIFIWNDKPYGQGGATKTLYQIQGITSKGTFLLNPSSASFLGRSIALNAKTTTNEAPLYIWSVGIVPFNRWGLKIYSLKISEVDNTIIDMIPVRVGNVGYMYDKVSGQLFGNAGTGNFILGADK